MQTSDHRHAVEILVKYLIGSSSDTVISEKPFTNPTESRRLILERAPGALAAIGEPLSEFCLARLWPADIDHIDTPVQLVDVVRKHLSHVSEIDDGGWSAL